MNAEEFVTDTGAGGVNMNMVYFPCNFLFILSACNLILLTV